MLEFADPRWFWLLLLVPLLAWRHIQRTRHGQGSLQFASTVSLEGVRPSWTVHVQHVLFGMSMLALVLAITAMARPRKGTQAEDLLTEGVDIMIALDASVWISECSASPQQPWRAGRAERLPKASDHGQAEDRVHPH